MKKILIIVLALSILGSACGKAQDPIVEPRAMEEFKEDIVENSEDQDQEDQMLENTIKKEGNLIHLSKDELELGKLNSLIFDDKNRIVLDKDFFIEVYDSPLIETEEFTELVGSWNAETPPGTSVELKVKLKIGDDWTDWFTYGAWSENGQRGSVDGQDTKEANMSIDVLEILYGKKASGLKYNVTLKRESGSEPGPVLKNIFLTLKTGKKEVEDFKGDYLVELDVPERSQMVVPEIGNVICSPTSLSMVLEYYGHNMETVDVAECALDKNAGIYGNWSYNAAFAGVKMAYAYVERLDSVEEVKAYIAEGIPVVASIKTSSEKTLEGAPQTYPSGHLIVIRGFIVKDGEEYVIVNDPAAPQVETVRREYKVKGFEKAWNGIVYVLREEFH